MRRYSSLISIAEIAFVCNSKWDTSCLTSSFRLSTEINSYCQIISQPTYTKQVSKNKVVSGNELSDKILISLKTAAHPATLHGLKKGGHCSLVFPMF